ncbi:YceI family protein [Streptomyces sp. NBC_01387]|uniref:YceI family protein n=1 Tax=unclassified Streptomyces TaxID=2593676 RepID=UPI002259FCAE|nr:MULTISPECIES: YceI family protein [unclassified Streptomyces]MCX4547568.1 YceI family protein [Streptomyces sp. NBC_01500]WSC19256.1 YceI family protein [Streptomyces sp. NBC_01766]WSV53279.1 YceI family protein [Streptomyces sp. NBC_01014]
METNRGNGAATPQLGRYDIDTSSSVIKFRTKHMFGLGSVLGTFAIRGGTVDVAEPLGESSVRVEIDTASFETGTEKRDSTVRSKTFLDTGRYPTMTFVSESVDATGITGQLTVREVTRPVTLAIQESRTAPGAFSAVATTRIDRLEFGVTGSRGMTGRYLDLTLEIQCTRT